MFERMTEAARKSVFFARFEAAAAGSPEINTIHLLLGILRGDPELAVRLIGSPEKIDQIRQRFVTQPLGGVGGVTDMPFNPEARRALNYAIEEAGKRDHLNIGCEHLLLGLALLRDTDSAAGSMLKEMNLTAKRLRKEVERFTEPSVERNLPQVPAGTRDLTAAAASGALDPLIGREAELERIIQTLLRRNRNWVALVGEAGVGKTALVHGLAQRIADGLVPEFLAGRTVLAIDAILLAESEELLDGLDILCLEGLFDLSPHDVARALLGLSSVIATGSPEGCRRFADLMKQRFEVVEVLAPTEAQAIQILAGVKHRYERFHGITISEETIRAAVTLSRRFLSRRLLPDRAIDLLDAAGAAARVKGKTELTPADIAAQVS